MWVQVVGSTVVVHGRKPDDTGWVTTGIPISAEANFPLHSYGLRRFGDRIVGQIVVDYAGSTVTATSAGNLADQAVLTMPAGWTCGNYGGWSITFRRVGWYVAFGRIQGGSGEVILDSAPGGTTIEPGHRLYLQCDWPNQ